MNTEADTAASGFRYVDLAAMRHLTTGLTFNLDQCATVLDHALGGLNEQAGIPDQLVAWIRAGAFAAGPCPYDGRGRIIIDIQQTVNKESQQGYFATVLRKTDERETALHGGAGCLDAIRYYLRFVFGDGGQDVQRETVGFRHVGYDEIRAGLHQPRYQSNVPGQTVETGYDKSHPLEPADPKGVIELRAVVLAAAFDLCDFNEHLAGADGEKVPYRHALPLKPEA